MTNTTNAQAEADGHRLRVPWFMPLFNALTRPLLRAGVPLGPNGLITVAGRKSGLQRTTPVAIIPLAGKRWVWAPWGDVQWVKNLRAAGRATITVRKKSEQVSATELDQQERAEFFRDVLAPLTSSVPGGYWFARLADGVDLHHPDEIARDRRVFELSGLGQSALTRSTDLR